MAKAFPKVPTTARTPKQTAFQKAGGLEKQLKQAGKVVRSNAAKARASLIKEQFRPTNGGK